MVLVIGLSFSKLKPSNQSILLVHFLALRFLNYLHLVIHTRNCFYHSTVELRFSGPRLSGLFLWSQFGDEYLLVTIKIHGHVLFKTTALKSAVKCEGFLFSKSKSSTYVCCEEQSNEFWLAQSCIVAKWNFTLRGLVAVVRKQRSLHHKCLVMMAMSLMCKQSVLAIKDKKEVADDIVFQMTFESVVPQLNVSFFM